MFSPMDPAAALAGGCFPSTPYQLLLPRPPPPSDRKPPYSSIEREHGAATLPPYRRSCSVDHLSHNSSTSTAHHLARAESSGGTHHSSAEGQSTESTEGISHLDKFAEALHGLMSALQTAESATANQLPDGPSITCVGTPAGVDVLMDAAAGVAPASGESRSSQPIPW